MSIGWFEIFLLGGVTFAVILMGVLAMVFGVMKSGKPIQHCGGASIGPNGEKLDCSLCGASPDQCDRKKAEMASSEA